MTTVMPALRVLNALHAGAVLVARPRGVVHIHTGRLSRNGHAVPSTERPMCRARTRRLTVVGHDSGDILPAVAGRRFCRTCIKILPPRLGYDMPLLSRDDWLTAFSALTIDDLWIATGWIWTVDEAHQVSRVLQMVHGPGHTALRRAINDRRRARQAANRSTEDIAHVQALRKAEQHDRSLVDTARRLEVARDRALERNRAGAYLMPWERQHVTT